MKLYLEVTPASDYSLDDVALGAVEDSGDWEEEADKRIDMIRRREVRLEVRLGEGVQAEDLVLEVVQDSHAFPFGTAVKSANIAACLDGGQEDNYCSFVRENFNWVVDTYRMKWRASEPSEGQIEMEVRWRLKSLPVTVRFSLSLNGRVPVAQPPPQSSSWPAGGGVKCVWSFVTDSLITFLVF